MEIAVGMHSPESLAVLEARCRALFADDVRTSINESLVPVLAEGLGADVLAHRPVRGEGSWESELMLTSGGPRMASFSGRVGGFLATAPLRYTRFDPLRVEVDQRNRVFGSAALRKFLVPDDEEPPVVSSELYRPEGLWSYAHMRVVLTDGPVFLQWLGFVRKEAFSRAEERLLAKLVPALARRLRDERVLWSGIPVSFGTVELALDLVGMPAFLVDSRGKLVFANEPALARLEQDPSIGREIVKATSASTYGPHVRTVTPVGGAGVARHHVVVLTDASKGLAHRLRFAEADAGLTSAEARVLARVVEGDPNKDIATRLGCSTRTVEVHVTSILAKCKVDSRTRLIAWFWTR